MKEASRHNYEKRIRELNQELNDAANKLYEYRTAIHCIYDGLTEIDGNGVSKNWIMKCIKRCLR